MLRQLCEDLSNARACVKHLKTEKHCCFFKYCVVFLWRHVGQNSPSVSLWEFELPFLLLV